MHIFLLNLNRLLEDNSPFKTELRVRFVNDKDLANVEFGSISAFAGRWFLLCRLHLTLPPQNIPRTVSITYLSTGISRVATGSGFPAK